MLFFALLAAALIGWTIWRDKNRARRRRNLALLLGVGAAILGAKGQWLLAALLGAGAAWVQGQGRFGGKAPALPAASDLAEARALLGVGPDASADEINAAHRRLIARNHPDAGGTEALASRINAARDLLLGHKKRL